MTAHAGNLPWKSQAEVKMQSTSLVALGYLAAVGISEALGVFVGPFVGMGAHVLLLETLLTHYALATKVPYRRLLPVLMLLPLLRILSLTMPIKQMPQMFWYALVGVPLLLAMALALQVLRLARVLLAPRLQTWPQQLFIASSGIPLGLAGYLILNPTVRGGFTWNRVVIGSLILILFVGFVEELLFRGLLQRVASELFGRWWGMGYSSVLFAIMYAGSLSTGFMVFMGLVGMFFSLCVNRTRALWGVALAHGLIHVGMRYIWPMFWS